MLALVVAASAAFAEGGDNPLQSERDVDDENSSASAESWSRNGLSREKRVLPPTRRYSSRTS